jgi:peptidoglycan/xylan/chitin deacetylase (PgdA/CDA1 family)
VNVRGLRRRWRLVLTLLALFLLSQVVWWTEPGALFVALEWLAPNIVWRVSTAEPLVGLSFDDGPNPIQTPQVLTILQQRQAHATFFLIGQRAAAHPELVAAIKAGGEVDPVFWTRALGGIAGLLFLEESRRHDKADATES